MHAVRTLTARREYGAAVTFVTVKLKTVAQLDVLQLLLLANTSGPQPLQTY